MVVIDELEIWKGELLLYEDCEFFLNRFCPTTYEDYELVDIPSDTTTRHLGVVASSISYQKMPTQGICSSKDFISAIWALRSWSDSCVIYYNNRGTRDVFLSAGAKKG